MLLDSRQALFTGPATIGRVPVGDQTPMCRPDCNSSADLNAVVPLLPILCRVRATSPRALVVPLRPFLSPVRNRDTERVRRQLF